MGVKPNFAISAIFMIGAVLTTLAGVMTASEYGNAHCDMDFVPGMKAFTASVLSGIGNVTRGVSGSNHRDVSRSSC